MSRESGTGVGADKLAHTSPPSPAALNPGDDLDHDGLTHRQEYQPGTDPNNPNSDADGLSDGVEVSTYHSNAVKPDTEGNGKQWKKRHRTNALSGHTTFVVYAEALLFG